MGFQIDLGTFMLEDLYFLPPSILRFLVLELCNVAIVMSCDQNSEFHVVC